MKPFLFLTTLVLITTSANCQLDKKYWLVGGAGSFYSYNDDFTTTGQPTVSGKLTEINLSANVGYFLYDKFVIGIRPGINSTKSKGYNSARAATKDISIYAGPFARYYLLNKEKQFNVLIDGAYQIGRHSTFAGKGRLEIASVMAGPEIFFNTSVGIELLVGYLYQKKAIHEEQSGFNDVQKGFHISVGFQFHLINN